MTSRAALHFLNTFDQLILVDPYLLLLSSALKRQPFSFTNFMIRITSCTGCTTSSSSSLCQRQLKAFFMSSDPVSDNIGIHLCPFRDLLLLLVLYALVLMHQPLNSGMFVSSLYHVLIHSLFYVFHLMLCLFGTEEIHEMVWSFFTIHYWVLKAMAY